MPPVTENYSFRVRSAALILAACATTLPSQRARAAGADGLAEANAALQYLETASKDSDAAAGRTDLQAAINCLVGPNNKRFKAVARAPCAGKGAIADVTDDSMKQQLQYAVGEAIRGLSEVDLNGIQMDVLAATDYMRGAGISGPAPNTASAATPFAVQSAAPQSAAPRSAAPVTIGADQVLASQLAGAALLGPDGTALGIITGIVIDIPSQAIQLVGLRAEEAGSAIAAIPWSELSPSREPGKTAYRSSLTHQELTGAAPFADQKDARLAYLDVEDNLIGRPVVTADGAGAGTLTDLVFSLNSGRIDYVLISGNSALPANGKRKLALPWSALADMKSERSVVLDIAQAQLAAAPRFVDPLP